MPTTALRVAGAIALTCVPAAADTVVAPFGNETVEGNGLLGSSPFNYAGGESRYMQMIDGAEFGSGGVSGTIRITGMWFRPDASQGSPMSETFGDLSVYLSSTQTAAHDMSASYADNIGADSTLVRSGAITLESANTLAAPSGPKAFDIFVGFDQAFVYDAGSSNLTVDLRVGSGGSLGLIDWHHTGGDGVRDMYFDGDADAAQGNLGTGGAVVMFEYTVVPAPGAGAAALVGVAMLGARRRRV